MDASGKDGPRVDVQTAVDAVAEASLSVREAHARLERSVAEARAAGATWSQIGDAAGMSRQSAHERWGHFPRAGCQREDCGCTEHLLTGCGCGHGPGRGRGRRAQSSASQSAR